MLNSFHRCRAQVADQVIEAAWAAKLWPDRLRELSNEVSVSLEETKKHFVTELLSDAECLQDDLKAIKVYTIRTRNIWRDRMLLERGRCLYEVRRPRSLHRSLSNRAGIDGRNRETDQQGHDSHAPTEDSKHRCKRMC